MSVIVIMNFEMLSTTIVVAGKKCNRQLSHSEDCDHKQLFPIKNLLLKSLIQFINLIKNKILFLFYLYMRFSTIYINLIIIKNKCCKCFIYFT